MRLTRPARSAALCAEDALIMRTHENYVRFLKAMEHVLRASGGGAGRLALKDTMWRYGLDLVSLFRSALRETKLAALYVELPLTLKDLIGKHFVSFFGNASPRTASRRITARTASAALPWPCPFLSCRVVSCPTSRP